MATNGDHQDSLRKEEVDLKKDEVGWYFVEQYYNKLSKSIDRLHLFYGTKSQFVSGPEAEVAAVAVGRQEIQKRIAQLGFQDAKVRISNVDSQASLDNIVIQVIGEISNKSEEPRKFVQTFVLAKQQAGYFVLNDILRYIKEEDEAIAVEDDAAAAEAAPAEAAAPTVEAAQPAQPAEVAEAAAAKPLDASVVDKKQEEVSAAAPEATATPAVPVVATPAVAKTEPAAAHAAPVAAAAPAPAADAEKAVKEVAEEETDKADAPKEPTSTATPPAPAAAPAAAPAEPEKPKGPPKPMTWASRAAAAAGTARPAVAVPKVAPVGIAAAGTRPAAPASASSPVSSQAAPVAKPALPENTAPGAAAVAAPGKELNSEWQTAGVDSKRQNRPVSISGHVQDKETTLGYVKYVTEKVENEALRSHLEQFGPLVYFDISRPKNCAFVEFGTAAGYQAAVAANPHVINGESIQVEARRPKASAYGGANYSRGGAAGRGGGRGGYESRNGAQGGRGGFANGRGRGGPARGRGGAQTVTAA